MKEDIKRIRELLDNIENHENTIQNQTIKDAFNLFELPQLVKDIVDFLQPIISPYEMDVYWFLFRYSILDNGDVFVRVSNAKIAKGIGSKFKNLDSQNARSGEKTVSDNLRSLETLKAIQKVGDTNREGTLYKIFLPEEIEACQEQMKLLVKINLPFVDPRKEQDHYNVKENRIKIFERDKYLCYKCNKQLTRFNATLDHIQPISEGGDNSFDNLATCCFHHNTSRRATPISEFIIK